MSYATSNETSSSRAADEMVARVVVGGAFLFVFFLVVQNSWVSEDSFITLRTIDNWLNGYGLRWNVGERVQAFTHPLWLLVVTPFYWLASGSFYSLAFLSVGVTLLTMAAFVYLICPNRYSAIFAIAALGSSKAFTDFSTSGLENPLSHLILVCFLAECSRSESRESERLGILALWSSLLMLCRLDLVLMCAPIVAYRVYRARRSRDFVALLAGSVPILAWELFALIYYGFALPNTYYAKLEHGISRGEVLVQGAMYFGDSIGRDPVTLTLIVIAVTVSFAMRRFRSVAMGVALYLLYVGWIGGDFMSGRFFTAPFVVAVGLLAQLVDVSCPKRLLTMLLLLVPFGAMRQEWWTLPAVAESRVQASGIVDEKLFYHQFTSLQRYSRRFPILDHGWAWKGLENRRSGERIMQTGNIGMLGFFSGPATHIVDTHGLGDPLIARLAPHLGEDWRIGHLERDLPPGYLKSVETGENFIEDPKVARLYDDLKVLTRDDLWSLERFALILRANTIGLRRDASGE